MYIGYWTLNKYDYYFSVLHTNIQFNIALNIKSSNKSIITRIEMIFSDR